MTLHFFWLICSLSSALFYFSKSFSYGLSQISLFYYSFLQKPLVLPSLCARRVWECTKKTKVTAHRCRQQAHTHNAPFFPLSLSYPRRIWILTKLPQQVKNMCQVKNAVEKLQFSASIAGFVTNDRCRIETSRALPCPGKKRWLTKPYNSIIERRTGSTPLPATPSPIKFVALNLIFNFNCYLFAFGLRFYNILLYA